ncbi:thymidylate synthase, partial [Streptococcus dysgalactiae]
IYDNQFPQAKELLKRHPTDCQPKLVLNVPDGTNFFDIKPEDFELQDYEPVKPQLRFDLAI